MFGGFQWARIISDFQCRVSPNSLWRDEEPRVCRLAAGGNRIRTRGPTANGIAAGARSGKSSDLDCWRRGTSGTGGSNPVPSSGESTNFRFPVTSASRLPDVPRGLWSQSRRTSTQLPEHHPRLMPMRSSTRLSAATPALRFAPASPLEGDGFKLRPGASGEAGAFRPVKDRPGKVVRAAGND